MSTAAPVEHTADESLRIVLREDLRRVVGRDVAEVRITRVVWDTGYRWCALALAVDPNLPFGHREVPLDADRREKIVRLIQKAFPRADWARAQDYDVKTGTLREHQVELPACLGGGEQ
ncbi:hypothetical protein [Streptomyces sp. NPDC056160]|uniref:hypothetical protein n=1 Tax=Streptomyces sp. NPDC056160 TaxID=3345731 RepID=UPI0035DF67DB